MDFFNSFEQIHVFLTAFGHILQVLNIQLYFVVYFLIGVFKTAFQGEIVGYLVAGCPEYNVRSLVDKSRQTLYKVIYKSVFIGVKAFFFINI